MSDHINNRSEELMTDFIVPYSFGANDRIVIDGVEYLYEKTDKSGHTFWNRADRIPEVFSHREVKELIDAGRMIVQADWHHAGRAELRLRNGGRTFDQLTSKKQKKALFRKDLCDRFLARQQQDRRISLTENKMKPVIDAIMADRDAENRRRGSEERCGRQIGVQEKAPDASTLRDWLREYKAKNFDIMALADNHRRPAETSKLSPEEEAIHEDYIQQYATAKKPSKASIYRRLEAYINKLNESLAPDEQYRILSQRAVERRIDRLNPVYKMAGRHGSDETRKYWRPANGGPDVERPFQRVEMDEWKMDVQALLTRWGVWQELPKEVRAKIPRQRIWMSVAIDVRTRVIPAVRFVLGQPSKADAISTLEMIVMPSLDVQESAGAQTPFTYGRPEEIVTDSGSAYVSEDFQNRVIELGADPGLPQAGNPEMRGVVERVFKTFKQRFIQHMSGRTFASVMEKGDNDPQAEAALVVNELNKLMVRGILDEYHNTPHSELGSETPFNCFRRLSQTYPISPPPGGEERRHIFGVPLKRRIAQEGVQVAGIRYQSDALQKLRRTIGQQEVFVRADRFDMGRISVWFPAAEGWLSVPARFSGLEGVSFWAWCDAVKDLKKRHHDTSKLSASVVRQAILDRDEAMRRAELEAGLDYTPMSPELFDETVDKHFANIGVRDEEADDGKGLGFSSAVEERETNSRSNGEICGASDNLGAPATSAVSGSDQKTQRPVEDRGEVSTRPDPYENEGDPEPTEPEPDDGSDIFGNPETWTSD